MRILLLLLPFCLLAQTDKPFAFNYGFKLGAPINEPTPVGGFGVTNTAQGRWTGGPMLELRLPKGLAVETNALYRTYRENNTSVFQLGNAALPYSVTRNQEGQIWDVPLLLKYRFQLGVVRPFVSAGYQWSHEARDRTFSTVCQAATAVCTANAPIGFARFDRDSTGFWQHGPTAGVGLEFRTRFVTIAPEVRFYRPATGFPRDSRFTGMVGFHFGRGR